MSSIVTRFAPSPTGVLHLGSARTALFNWLYARHYGGRFLLRLEDTDQVRSSTQSADNILANLQWLGLQWDDELIIQSQRKQRHQEIAYQLLAMGQAYRCYCTPEELAEMKATALANGIHAAYDRRWRARSDEPANTPFVIRLKAPLTGELIIHDTVQGMLKVDCSQMDDMVLLRSDGTPTYMLAVVVDDHDMGITHIIRGDDHLTNAFRQLNLYHALNWVAPSMSHIPLIHGPDGAKLSKRHGAVGVDHYRAEGFLPETMINGLLRLGWSHGNEEKITCQQAVAWFDGTALSKSAARFDRDKFLALNGHYLRQRDPDSLWHDLVQEPLEAPRLPEHHWDKGQAILPALAQRCVTLCDLRNQVRPYLSPLLDTPPVVSDEDRDILKKIVNFLSTQDPWTGSHLEAALRLWAKDQGISFGAVAKPMRLVLTGQAVSPSLTDVMVALGAEWTLLRIQQAC